MAVVFPFETQESTFNDHSDGHRHPCKTLWISFSQAVGGFSGSTSFDPVRKQADICNYLSTKNYLEETIVSLLPDVVDRVRAQHNIKSHWVALRTQVSRAGLAYVMTYAFFLFLVVSTCACQNCWPIRVTCCCGSCCWILPRRPCSRLLAPASLRYLAEPSQQSCEQASLKKTLILFKRNLNSAPRRRARYRQHGRLLFSVTASGSGAGNWSSTRRRARARRRLGRGLPNVHALLPIHGRSGCSSDRRLQVITAVSDFGNTDSTVCYSKNSHGAWIRDKYPELQAKGLVRAQAAPARRESAPSVVGRRQAAPASRTNLAISSR